MGHLVSAVGQCVTLRSPLCPDRCDERFDADDVHHSRQVVGKHERAISVATFGRVFVKKCVAPIRAFIVPNGCSTVSRRTRMACGLASRRS